MAMTVIVIVTARIFLSGVASSRLERADLTVPIVFVTPRRAACRRRPDRCALRAGTLKPGRASTSAARYPHIKPGRKFTSYARV